MRLDSLVLHGFKSFAEKTSFDFRKNFTAIVGPNGSGKSNVSDAIRWVLGEQSVKTLRGKASTDLIFGGSEQLAKLGMAVVELHLNNSDHTIPLEYDEVVISRKLFRDGESEYRINGAKVRLQDILLMLAKARFGQKSYAVIGQGMITEFLNSSPQQRKEFFDEATGVKEFQMKRDQAINKLIRTEENLIQCEALLGEIEPHLKSLTRQVNRLQKREKIEAELRELQVLYYGSLWHELIAERAQLSKQLEQIGVEITGLEKEMAATQTQSDALAGNVSRGERYEQLQKQFNEVLEEKSEILKEQAVLKGKLEVEHEKQGKLSLVWLQRKEDEILKSVHGQEREIALLREQHQRTETTLARSQQQLESVSSEFRDEEYNILKLRDQIENEAHALSIPEIQTSVREIFGEQEQFLEELLLTTSLEQFRGVQKRAKHLTERMAAFLDELTSEDKGTIEALRVEMKQKEQALERLVKEREKLQHECNELRITIESGKNKIQFLHAQLNREQEALTSIQSDLDEAKSEKDDARKNAQAEQYTRLVAEYEQEIGRRNNALQSIRTQIDSFNQEEEAKKSELLKLQSEIRTAQRKLTAQRQQQSTIEVNLARVETRQEDVQAQVRRDVAEDIHSRIFDAAPVTTEGTPNRAHLQEQMGSMQRQLEAIGSVDQATVAEYEETKNRFEFLGTQTKDLSEAMVSLEKIIDELDKTIHAQFQKNFKLINDGFQKYFKVLFGGGKATLELLTEQDVEPASEAGTPNATEAAEAGMQPNDVVETLEEEKKRELIGKKKKKQKLISGIEVLASPPSKKVTHVAALSGGEKSLIAIALLCAIIGHHPSPFVVLDEVEAALDEENSEKFSAIIKELSKHTQLIIITHNRVTMRMADILYGVTMGKDGRSHILSVELKEAEQMVEGA